MEIVKKENYEIISVGGEDKWQVVAVSKDYMDKYKVKDIIYHIGQTFEEIFSSTDNLNCDIWVFSNGHYVFGFHWYKKIVSVRANFRLKRVDFKQTTPRPCGGYFTPSTACFCMYDSNPALKEITKALREAFRFSRGLEPIEIDEKKDMLTYEYYENLSAPKRVRKPKE